MDFYRGDDRSPLDAVIRRDGFTAKPPARPMSGTEARAFLQGLFAKGMTTNDIGMTWREATPGNLVATAMTQAGGFQGKKHFYKIVVPDQEVTLQALKMKGQLGETFPVEEALTKGGYFLLYDTGSYQTANLIAFCHGIVNTKEATFLTSVPARYIAGDRGGANTTKEGVPFAPFAGPHRSAPGA